MAFVGLAAFLAGFTTWHELEPCSKVDRPPVGQSVQCSDERGPSALGLVLHTGGALVAGTGFAALAPVLARDERTATILETGRQLRNPMRIGAFRTVWMLGCALLATAAILDVGLSITHPWHDLADVIRLVGLGFVILVAWRLAVWSYVVHGAAVPQS